MMGVLQEEEECLDRDRKGRGMGDEGGKVQ